MNPGKELEITARGIIRIKQPAMILGMVTIHSHAPKPSFVCDSGGVGGRNGYIIMVVTLSIVYCSFASVAAAAAAAAASVAVVVVIVPDDVSSSRRANG